MSEGTQISECKNLVRPLFATISGTLFAISDGMTYGWTAPFTSYLESEESHIAAEKPQLDWLETGYLIGAFCGLPITTYLVDSIGRKKSLLLASTCVLVAWIAIALADRIEYVIVARFVCGISGNMAFVAAPMYVAEIADQNVRGFLASIIYFMMILGCLIVYSVGPFLPFYIPSAIGIGVALTELVLFSTVPESPIFLLNKNKVEDAKKSLEYFKPWLDAEDEIKTMSGALEIQKLDTGKFTDIFFVPSVRKSVIIMAVLNGGQHLSAYSVILMNLHPILEEAGSIYMDSSITAIVFAALMLVAVIVGSTQIDRYGRKFLLIMSSFLTGLCLLAISVYFHLKYLEYDVLLISWIPIVSVMVYAVVFKIGVGLVPIVVTAEIFPTNLKALGMTLADATFIIGGIVGIQLYQRLKVYGIFTPFYIFTVSSFLVTIFTIFCVPETKGKTLDEIQDILKGKGRGESSMNLDTAL